MHSMSSHYKLAHPRHHLSPFPLTANLHPTRITLTTRTIPIRSCINSGSVTRASSNPAPTLYDVLGISEHGTLGEIKKAYKEMARRYHPDVSPPGRVDEYTERFIRVKEAYETLSDPNRRALYDGGLGSGLHLAFSARRGCNSDTDMEDKSEWKNRWQSQLSELKRRSTYRNTRGNMSWSETVRRQNSDLSDEE